MEKIDFLTFKFALDFSKHLNEFNPKKDSNFIVIEQSDQKLSIQEDTSFPIEEKDFQMLIFVDSQDSKESNKPTLKWEKLLRRLSKLDGSLFITMQFTPTKNSSKDESNKTDA